MDIWKKDILIWGAGKIGRGFIADLFGKSGYHIDFVDSSKEVVKGLRERGKYTLLNLPDTGEKNEVTINNFGIYHTGEKEFLNNRLVKSTLIALSVFPAAMEQVSYDIAAALEERALLKSQPILDIMLCTNIINSSLILKELLKSRLSENGRLYLEEKVGIIETVIMRIAIEPGMEEKNKDPFVVATNGYQFMPVDKAAFKGELPAVEGIIYTGNIFAEEIRKMYTYNMVHAAYAYLGKRKNYVYIHDCTEDMEIQETAVGCLDEVSRALQMEFGFTENDMRAWNKNVIRNMSNPLLMDSINRVGGDPARKLKRDDRLVGPAILCCKNGIVPINLAKAIAYAFLFDNPEDASSRIILEFVRQNDIQPAIRKYCQLDGEEELIQLIANMYKMV